LVIRLDDFVPDFFGCKALGWRLAVTCRRGVLTNGSADGQPAHFEWRGVPPQFVKEVIVADDPRIAL
jgi:hypothetical protein